VELPERRLVIAGAVVALLLVAAFLSGFAATESETELETTIITSQSGDVEEPDDNLILVVVGGSRLTERFDSFLEDALTDEGYDVTVEDSTEEVYDSPVLVVEITNAAVGVGFARHIAETRVLSYYSTTGNATGYERFRDTGSTVQRETGAVVTGEYRLRDTTRGFVTNRGYRGRITETVVSEVVSRFRG
jgi:hypothetical protein